MVDGLVGRLFGRWMCVKMSVQTNYPTGIFKVANLAVFDAWKYATGIIVGIKVRKPLL